MKIAAITPDRKFDYLADLVIEGLLLGGHELTASDVGNGIAVAAPDDDFVRAALEADMVLAFFGKRNASFKNRPPKHQLLGRPELTSLPRERIAYIDGSEWTYTAHPSRNQVRESLKNPERRRGEPWLNEAMHARAGHYFKRETYAQDLERGIVPLPFGLSPRRHLLPSRPKDIDLSCVFGQTATGLRAELVRACTALRRARDDCNIVVAERLQKGAYEDILARSKIVVDAWGCGDCCDRFWEAVGAKACCLYQRYNILFPKRFEDWSQAVSFGSMREFHERVNALLDDPDRAERIGTAGHEHALLHHTATARAEQIRTTLGV